MIISNGLSEQALKSGQLPVDLEDRSRSGNIQESDKTTAQSIENVDDNDVVPTDAEDETEPMEQVFK